MAFRPIVAFGIAAGELKERRRVAAFEGQRESVDMR
jgi:hypothetical protein